MRSGDASSSSRGDDWGGHRGVDLCDTDLGGISIHSAGLVKMSSGDVSSSSRGDDWGGHRGVDLRGIDLVTSTVGGVVACSVSSSWPNRRDEANNMW